MLRGVHSISEQKTIVWFRTGVLQNDFERSILKSYIQKSLFKKQTLIIVFGVKLSFSQCLRLL
jgi:hypothetical protein